ncbi:hypothetical protein [Nannocystis bainbridge]|uniref:Uncharacterized protein n=1 Tax=Nannocystis bainbridge TaxID=2995303 RepID=A0ABT5DR72_9BACT|nr:hypothetical protein [Nannocystis bainbridge]MDC0716156.1 hypothetical protein [Nannocystis bainbridge]
MDAKIQEALLVALRALPKVMHVPQEEWERHRVCVSADATAYCREKVLLSETQFISYTGWYPAAGTGKLIPSAYDGSKSLGYLPPEVDQNVERDLELPEDQELRAEFLGINDRAHPLFQHPIPPTYLKELLR